MKNNIDEDVKIVEEINKKNNFIFYEKINNIFETLKKNEFSFQFKSDLTYVIDALINKQINSNVLSACEMIMKNQVYEIQKEKEKRYEKRIEYLDKELETYKNKIAEIKKWCDAVENSEFSSKFFIDGKEISTDTGYCLDLAEPILEIINRKDLENGE